MEEKKNTQKIEQKTEGSLKGWREGGLKVTMIDTFESSIQRKWVLRYGTQEFEQGNCSGLV